jgi:hypothetical protein
MTSATREEYFQKLPAAVSNGRAPEIGLMPERMNHSLRSGGRLGASIQQGCQPKPPAVTPPASVRHIDTASRW